MFKKVFSASLLLAFNLFIFGTYVIFSNNHSDFQISYFQVFNFFILETVVLLAVIGLFFLLFRRFQKSYLAFLLTLGILTYIHANVLVWDIGILDGNDLDFTDKWRGWIDGLLWLTAFFVAFRYRDQLVKHALHISVGLILLQLLASSIGAFSNPEPLKKKAVFQEPPKPLAQFSSRSNVIQLILDAFQANIFAEFVAENPDYNDLFSGFTFFKDAITSSSVTYLSVPAFLSGDVFRNKRLVSEYWQDTFDGVNLYDFLSQQNFDVEVATPLSWNKDSDAISNYYNIPTPYSGEQQIKISNSLLLSDISLFRHAPYFLKPFIYNSQSWLLSRLFIQNPELRFEHFSHNAFFEDLTAGISKTDRNSVYKSIHLVTPHAPLVSKKDCTSAGEALPYNKDNYKRQALCTLRQIEKFLTRLKDEGIYDSSLILIHGDHGAGNNFDIQTQDGNIISSMDSKLKMWGSPLPLVLIKKPYAKNKLRISNSQVQLSDIPATVSSVLEFNHPFPGTSMFDISEEETIERRYYWSDLYMNTTTDKGFFDVYHSFIIKGSVYKEASWSKAPSFQANVLNENGTYKWDTWITFGTEGTSKPFQEKGWRMRASESITWTDGKTASLTLGFPTTTNDVTLRAKVKAFLAPGKLDSQKVIISIGSKKVGEWNISDTTFHVEELIIPQHFFSKKEAVEILFEFPDARAPADLGVGKDNRTLGLAFRSIQFKID